MGSRPSAHGQGHSLHARRGGKAPRGAWPVPGKLDIANPPGRILVVAAFCARDGALLLGRRSTGGSLGLWELPGGKAEAGESVMQALARELSEELGLSAEFGGILFDADVQLGERACRFVVIETRLSGEPTASSAHDAIAWVAPSEIGAYSLAPLDVPVLPGLLHLLGRQNTQPAT